MRLDGFFQDQRLVALTSDASVDFTPADFDSPLTPQQRVYLRKECQFDVPKVFWRKQVHGDDVLEATGTAWPSAFFPDADALVTKEKNLPIAVRTADCVPVFIFDPHGPFVALAHAGWRGTHKAIAAKTVDVLRKKYGSKPSDLKIVLGPGIRDCCYQVGAELAGHFPAYVRKRDNALYADLFAANRDQLMQAGVGQDHIFDTGTCTCCHKDYFSYRRDGGKAGRMISLMMLL